MLSPARVPRSYPLNRRLGDACTKWQMKPAHADPVAFNDDTDWR
jgi:hypothetical protein